MRAAERPVTRANVPRVITTATAPQLRPLGLGELLDRGVTLCVKNFVPFALIYVAYATPLGFITFFASRRNALMIEAVTEALRGGVTGTPSDSTAMTSLLSSSSPNDLLWSVVLGALFFFVGPLATAALIDATTEGYAGRLPTFAHAYRTGVARWLPMIGINLLFGAAIFALYVVLSLVVVVIALAVVALVSVAHAVGVVIGVVLGIVLVVALVVAFLVALLMLQMAYFTCVVEAAGPVTAFSRGVGRIANRIGIRRAMLVGFAYFAVSIGIFIVSALGQETLVGLLHSRVLGTVFSTIVGVLTAAFLTAFMTIFYYDLRVREEGLDLELAARASFAAPLEGA
jgi:hypothetical protein